jgi:hypothetical protein
LVEHALKQRVELERFLQELAARIFDERLESVPEPPGMATSLRTRSNGADSPRLSSSDSASRVLAAFSTV